MVKNNIPKASLRRMMKQNGVERLSGKAIDELSRSVESQVGEIAQKSKQYASHAGRKTVKDTDIRLATRL